MNAGDRVTVVHNLPPDGITVGVVVDGQVDGRNVGCVHDGKVAVRPVNADDGAWMWFPVGWVDPGIIRVDRARARSTDPDTAHAAAQRTADQLREHQWHVLDAIVRAGTAGMLDHDHVDDSGLIQTSAGKRRLELERLGLVEATGDKRLTPSQRWARTYRATARGRAVWQTRQRGVA